MSTDEIIRISAQPSPLSGTFSAPLALGFVTCTVVLGSHRPGLPRESALSLSSHGAPRLVCVLGLPANQHPAPTPQLWGKVSSPQPCPQGERWIPKSSRAEGSKTYADTMKSQGGELGSSFHGQNDIIFSRLYRSTKFIFLYLLL